MQSEWPRGFLADFSQVCQDAATRNKSGQEISDRVRSELEMDFPLVSQEDLEAFLEFSSCLEPGNEVLPNERYLKGILSAMQTEDHQMETDNENRMITFAQVILITILLPLLKLLTGAPNNIERIERFLMCYNVENRIAFVSPGVGEDNVVCTESVIDCCSSRVEEFENNSDDSEDSEWESYASGTTETNESSWITEDVQQPLPSVPWDLKIVHIITQIDEYTWDIIFTHLSKEYDLCNCVLDCIKSLFDFIGDSDELCTNENIQKITAQLVYLLQNYIINRRDEASIIFPLLVDTLLPKEQEGGVVNQIKQAFLLNIFSKMVEGFSAKKQNYSSVSLTLVKGIKSQMNVYQKRIMIIRDTVKLLSKVADEISLDGQLSAVILELTDIVNVLRFVIESEKGHIDTQIAEQLLSEQIIQNFVLMLVSLYKNFQVNSLLMRNFTETCNEFLILCSIYQPSVAIFLSKVRTLKEVFSLPEFIECYPQHSVLYFLLCFQVSGFSKRENLEFAKSTLIRLFSQESAEASVNKDQLKRKEACLRLLLEWNDTLPLQKNLQTHPQLQEIISELRVVNAKKNTTDIPSKLKNTYFNINKLLKSLLTNNAQGKTD